MNAPSRFSSQLRPSTLQWGFHWCRKSGIHLMFLCQQISYANPFAQHQLGFQWLEWISEKSTNSDAYEENHRVQ